MTLTDAVYRCMSTLRKLSEEDQRKALEILQKLIPASEVE